MLGLVAACGGHTTVDGSSSCTTFDAVTSVSNVDKLDVLFVIDNSTSMADVQVLLGKAVPALVERLIDPPCVAQDGTPGSTPASPMRPATPASRGSSNRSATSMSAW